MPPSSSKQEGLEMNVYVIQDEEKALIGVYSSYLDACLAGREFLQVHDAYDIDDCGIDEALMGWLITRVEVV